MFKAFASEFIPATGDMQAIGGFIVIGFGGINAGFERVQPICIFAVPGEEQAVGSGFEGGLCTTCVGGGKFNDESGGTWFRLRAIFAQEAHTGTTLSATGLC